MNFENKATQVEEHHKSITAELLKTATKREW